MGPGAELEVAQDSLPLAGRQLDASSKCFWDGSSLPQGTLSSSNKGCAWPWGSQKERAVVTKQGIGLLELVGARP